jgi:ribonuclease HI
MGERDERFIRKLLSGSTLRDAAATAGLSEDRARAFLESVASFAGSVGDVPRFGEGGDGTDGSGAGSEAPEAAQAAQEAVPAGEVKPQDELVIYTDGSSSGNPGPAGAGVVILTSTGETLEEFREYLGEQTNNVAEYRAVWIGLSKAIAYGARRVTVRLDSELVAMQLSGRYKVRDKKLIEQYLKVGELLAKLDDVRFEVVPREENSRADRLAQNGARMRA